MSDTASGVGTALREIRERRGLTRHELADRAGVSVPTIQALEQHPERGARMATLHRLATALGVRTSELLRTRRPMSTVDVEERATALLGIRAALSTNPRLSGTPIHAVDTDEAPSLRRLHTDTALATRAYHEDRYDVLLETLPQLIADCRVVMRATTGHERDQAYAALGSALRVAGRGLKQVSEHDLAVTAFEQSITASDHGGDAAGAAHSVSLLAQTFMRQRRVAEAADMCIAAAEAIRPRDRGADTAVLDSWGTLLSTAAAAATRDGRGEVDDLLAEATHAAQLLPPHRWEATETRGCAEFGPNKVETVTAECAMIQDRPQVVLDIARRVPRTAPLAPSTLHRHRLDVALAELRSGRAARAAEIIADVKQDAPRWLAQQRYGRDIVTELIEKRRRLSPVLASLADTVGVPV